MARYIVLRDQALPLGAAFQHAPACPDPVIEIASMTAADLRDAARDPSVLACFRSMPTRMTAPVPLDDARPEDATPGWGLRAVGAKRAHSSAPVALLDTGIDADHACFDGVRVIGRDFTKLGLLDAHGHGTHLAATVLGRDYDGARVGVTPAADGLIVAKVLQDNGTGQSHHLFTGILWAAEQGAQVLGFALTPDVRGFAEQLINEGLPDALATSVAVETGQKTSAAFSMLVDMIDQRYAARGGVVLICAAGNDSRRMIAPDFEVSRHGLAAAPSVLAIGAVAQDHDRLMAAPFSNTGPDLVAPGVGILSAAAGDGLRAANSTSSAMAFAVGVASVWRAGLPSAMATRRALLDTASLAGIDPAMVPLECGAGLVQLP